MLSQKPGLGGGKVKKRSWRPKEFLQIPDEILSLKRVMGSEYATYLFLYRVSIGIGEEKTHILRYVDIGRATGVNKSTAYYNVRKLIQCGAVSIAMRKPNIGTSYRIRVPKWKHGKLVGWIPPYRASYMLPKPPTQKEQPVIPQQSSLFD